MSGILRQGPRNALFFALKVHRGADTTSTGWHFVAHDHNNRTEMETFVVEAIRQLPALVLAVLAIYFYRSAQRASEMSAEVSSIPDDLVSTLEALAARADRFDSDLQSLRDEL